MSADTLHPFPMRALNQLYRQQVKSNLKKIDISIYFFTANGSGHDPNMSWYRSRAESNDARAGMIDLTRPPNRSADAAAHGKRADPLLEGS